MLAVVKEPHIEMSLGGTTENITELLDFIRSKYSVEVLMSIAKDDDEEYVDAFKTDFWKEMTPGKLLAGYRLKHDMTQQQLAEKSGIHHVVISAYETGKRNLSKKAAIKLANAMGEDPELFFRHIK